VKFATLLHLLIWTSARVKNEWIYASTPPECLHVADRDHFRFYTFVLLEGLRTTSIRSRAVGISAQTAIQIGHVSSIIPTSCG